MQKRLRPIIVIDDDADDLYLLEMAFAHLGIKNKVMYFSDSLEAHDYLVSHTSEPFLILSDINMPRMDGFTLRKKVVAEYGPGRLTIPFVFLTTGVNYDMLMTGVDPSLQGYFLKPTSMPVLFDLVERIVSYWNTSESPENFSQYN